MEGIAIRTDDLTRDFDSVRALDGLSLAVPRGTLFGLLGPNGSGKTTTIRLLLGLLEPTRGRAEVLGFDTRTHADEARQLTGALLEHDGLYERLSAEDNLEFYARIARLPVARRKARVEELLTGLGLWERRREPVGTWSRGMKQKLAVARAILHHPPLVFLDEPTAGLDAVAAAEVRQDLAGLVAREGVTVFLTTHNLTEAERLCGMVGIIRQGKLLAAGHPDELRARSAGQRVEVVGRGFGDGVLTQLQAQPEVVAVEPRDGRLLIDLREDAETAPLVGLLVGAGAQVEEVRKARASLEDAFLSLVREG